MRDPSTLVILGASGDLTRRLLLPALYHLHCDGLMPERWSIVGMAMDAWSTLEFRDRMSAQIRQFSTREVTDEAWSAFVARLEYVPGRFDDPEAFARLAASIREPNVLFYMATPPSVFGLISRGLRAAGLHEGDDGWRRVIVEKPFGHDLASAVALNREILASWREDQVYRIDHYLGKETVQNLLACRFSNGIFEPLWNRQHIDHIQFTVAESVGVEGRGAYYDKVGVLRDMIQNHMFQMLAYLCMEAPSSFAADAIRNEKAKLLDAVRLPVMADVVRGQYGPGASLAGYREEPSVAPESSAETFAAMKLHIDNWRWDGVPIYLRSGKRLWKRGTEIVVQFKRPPGVLFRGTPVTRLDANRLIFHMQPDQGIELRLHAKLPGPALRLQNVSMRFAWGESFRAARAIGYEVLLHNCMVGDQTLFSRTDLVEGAWRIAQPILDGWAEEPPHDFPNYPAGSWGPKAAFDLLERDGRAWVEVINRHVLERVPLFAGLDPVFLNTVANVLQADVWNAGDVVLRIGDEAKEMYFLARGEVEVLDADGRRLRTLGEGDYFGEVGLVLARPRTATVRAVTQCDIFVLARDELEKVLAEHPRFAEQLHATARERYGG